MYTLTVNMTDKAPFYWAENNQWVGYLELKNEVGEVVQRYKTTVDGSFWGENGPEQRDQEDAANAMLAFAGFCTQLLRISEHNSYLLENVPDNPTE
jgi:hypothetical protein